MTARDRAILILVTVALLLLAFVVSPVWYIQLSFIVLAVFAVATFLRNY